VNMWNRLPLVPRQDVLTFLLESQQKHCENRIAAVERRAEQEIDKANRQDSYASTKAFLSGYLGFY